MILAGGLATRLGDVARQTPKFLLPVAGRPFAAWLLPKLSEAGFRDVALAVGHLADEIRRALGDGSRFGLRLHYSDEGDARLGTGGALRLAAPLLRETFLLTYGDSYLPFDYASPLADLEARPEALGTMAVLENHDALDASNVEVAGDLVVRYAKRARGAPNEGGLRFIDYGALALRREALSCLPEGPSDLGALQAELAQRGALRALIVHQRFFEIGSESGISDLTRELAK